MSSTSAPARTMRVTEFVARKSNSLRGFAKVEQPSGQNIHEVAIHRRDDGTAWASPPSKPMLDRSGQHMKGADGKALWVQLISFSSKDHRDRWSDAVIAALRESYPEALS
jgi:hypothetical protein